MSLEPFALPERYRLERGIAAGGMAAVYAAHDTVLDRPVAVKVLADHLNGDPTARARFEREARAAAGLSNHPGVVTIFDVGEFNGRAFLVMERREGGTIGEAGRVSHDRAVDWLSTVADAVDAAHERGVVHRDIKPGNLLLDERGNVAVADFGIASLMDDTERFTQTGQVLGTAAYLSPEQALGKPATPASDRYSLAVVAYELLTGEKPFTTANFAAQARAHIEDPPPDAPGLPSQVQQVLKRGLAKSPDDRWPTARALVDALATALAAPRPAAVAPPPAVATEQTRAMPATAPAPAPAAAAAAAAAPRPRRDGRRTGTLLAGLALLLVVVAAGAIALGGDGDDPAGSGAQQAGVAPGKQKAKGKDKDPKANAAPEPQQTAAPEQAVPETPVETPAATEVDATGDPAALNAEGYELYLAEDYEAAIPLLEQAVAACGVSTALDPCGYAVYNYGSALHRAGRSEEAIPIIEDRLNRFEPFKVEEVQAELDAARAAAGE